MINNLIFVVNSFCQIYFWLILVRCFLSFVPTINWYQQPFSALKDTTDMYLNIFKKIVPPIGGLDFSPIIAIIALQILNYLIVLALYMLK